VAAGFSYEASGKNVLWEPKKVLKGIIGLENVQHVTHTKARYMLKNSIVPCFSDAAKGYMDSLDTAHRLTRAFVNKAAASPSRGKLIFSNDQQGMKTRNVIMTALGVRHAQKQGAEILIHAVGGDHVFGDGRFFPYEESMHYLYEQAGFNVLAYVNERGTDRPLPQEAPTDKVQMIKGWNDLPQLGARSNAERMEIYRTAKASKGLIDFADISEDEQATAKQEFLSYIQAKGYKPKS
jgi:hypothetical protein